MVSGFLPPLIGGHPSVLVVGEALVDEVTTDAGTVSHPGGSPFNVAVGVARLGVPTLLHTAVGDDRRGALLGAHARESSLELTTESLTTAATSFARARIGEGGIAGYDFSADWHPAPFTLPSTPTLVHVGSIGAMVPPGCDLVAGIVSALRARSVISFDPNVRPALIADAARARQRAAELIALADVVKASDEDVEWLHPGRNVDDVAAEWLSAGPDLVVITRGDRGPTACSRWGTHRSLLPATAVTDTIGAGDSFAAGLIVALIDGGAMSPDRLAGLDADRIDAAVEFATRCAAITVSRAGAQPPWRDEIARAI
jgi:fructokinase